VVGLGIKFISPANWHPFVPHGWPGIQSGAAILFFAFIGFDAVSTPAEECKNPGRDLPPGIPGSTNALRVHRIGDAKNRVAPAYSDIVVTPSEAGVARR